VTTWLVLDVSASMAFGTGTRLKSDVTEGVAEVVSRLAVRRGGRIGVVVSGPTRVRLLAPRGGRGALAAIRRLVQQGVAADGAKGAALGAALVRVARLARSRGVVVVVSDFRDEGWTSALRSLGARHTVVAVEVTDPRERELPDAGHLVLVDPETGRQVEAPTSSPALRRAYAEAEARRRAAVAGTLKTMGATHVALSTADDWLGELARRMR
jgi:uncharacterized protein (DUF58 family)